MAVLPIIAADATSIAPDSITGIAGLLTLVAVALIKVIDMINKHFGKRQTPISFRGMVDAPELKTIDKQLESLSKHFEETTKLVRTLSDRLTRIEVLVEMQGREKK